MKSGINCKLTLAEVEDAVKLRTYDLRLARRLAVPEDRLDFLQRSAVHWMPDGTAMVTWEE
jgi:hypothetical protein